MKACHNCRTRQTSDPDAFEWVPKWDELTESRKFTTSNICEGIQPSSCVPRNQPTNNPKALKMNNPFGHFPLPTTPTAPSRSFAPTEPLSPNGDNLAFLSPDLAMLMDDLRAKVNTARAWPVAGRYSKEHPTFNPFQRLPHEIRARIYELASYQPRVIEVTCHDKPMSDTPVPALIHASSESRKIALKVYEPLVLEDVETGTFVNWDLDTIFLNDRRAAFNRHLSYPILHEKCKKLALPGTTFTPFNLPPEYKHLETLVVVLKVAPGDGNLEFVPVDCDEEAMSRPRQALVTLWESKRIKSYMIRDSIRGQARSMLDPKEKDSSRKRREKERRMVEPLRSDEDVAIRLQYDLDHGRL